MAKISTKDHAHLQNNSKALLTIQQLNHQYNHANLNLKKENITYLKAEISLKPLL